MHNGFASIFTITSSGQLYETFLTAIGNDWTTQNLTTKYQFPAVDWALVHPDESGGQTWLSVVTGTSAFKHLLEVYLPRDGDP